LAFTNAGSFDPNLDANCNGGVVAQTGGPDLCVVHYRSISIADGSTVLITGNGTAQGRVIAFVADDDLTIAGTLDIAAHGAKNGPGGGVLDSGGHANNPTGNGGGGAGGSTPGAPGGNASIDGGASNGGAAIMNPALFSALIGGSSCGRGATLPDVDDMFMAGGGGAATLVSCHGVVMVSGIISAGGAGGIAGFKFGTSIFVPGQGGGAGGYVVLQGLKVDVTGQLFANGGAGGGGMQSNQNGGMAGQDGQLSDVFPAQGGSTQTDEGAGGAGGIGTADPQKGKHPAGAGATAGGGGGSVGFLQIYTPEGLSPTVTPSHVSPAFQPNGVALTR
jgi:hypothetical protein